MLLIRLLFRAVPLITIRQSILYQYLDIAIFIFRFILYTREVYLPTLYTIKKLNNRSFYDDIQSSHVVSVRY